LFKWNGGCMVDRLVGGASGKSNKGNVFCAHRGRVPLVSLALDALSFPMMIREAQKVRPVVPQRPRPADGGDAAGDAAAAAAPVTTGTATVDKEALTKAYINIKPFCEKWPACAALW
jgi:hypothetical protein